MLEKHINPFLNDLVVPYIQYVTKLESNGMSVVENGFEVEQAQFFRVYTNVKIREFLFQKLSMYARDMLSAIQHFVHSDNQYVILSYDKMKSLYGDEYNLVKRRYDDTVRELIRMSIIDYKNRGANQYWYNPLFFCQKSRVKMFPECAIKVTTVYLDNK